LLSRSSLTTDACSQKSLRTLRWIELVHDFAPKWPLQAAPRVPNVLVEHVAERIPHSGSGPVESLAECGDSNPRIIEPAHMLVGEEHGEQHRVWIGGQIFLDQTRGIGVHESCLRSSMASGTFETSFLVRLRRMPDRIFWISPFFRSSRRHFLMMR
jgi:hypothetical protein